VNRLTIFFSVLLFLLTTTAQVTITQADVEANIALGNTVTSFADTLGGSVDIGAPGQSSWDFSGHQFQLEFDATTVDNSNSPSAATFSGATHTTYSNPTFAGVTSETWVHLSVGGNAYSDLGTFTTAEAFGFTTNTTIVINPAEVILQLPLTFGASWSQSGVRDVETEIVGLSTQNYSVDYTINRTVDAWGTLTMPNGTSEGALRVKIETELTNNVTGSPITTNMVSYLFITPSGNALTVTAADPNASDNGTIDAEDVSWSYGNGTPSDVEQIEELAADFNLSQNYPNPFNPTTNIRYSIPEASHVSLKVYDVLGNEVAELVNEELNAGVYNSAFNAANLSSGIYFYTLRAENFTATKKLMLVK
jgi:hypothetical protein